MLKQRVITALILAPIIVGGLFFLPPLGFAIFTGAILTLGAWEWANLSGASGRLVRIAYALLIAGVLVASVLLSVADCIILVLWLVLLWWLISFGMIFCYPAGTRIWQAPAVRMLTGLPVLVGAWLGLNYLRSGDLALGRMDSNLLLILFAFCIVWIADIGAYFAGRAWGKRKLAPRVSPGKSWAGVYGGVAAALGLAALVAWLAGCTPGEGLILVLISGITAFISVLGDLYESMLKRLRGIKDSSQLLPGHGGILDRVDSLTAALPVFALLLSLAGWLAPAALV